MLRALLLVGLGGCFGSMARYAVSMLLGKTSSSPFPVATFSVNLIGCFIIGLLFGLGNKTSWAQGDGWLILATGFCGGFTTFSAFALENSNLFDKNLSVTALLYIALSIIGGILLCRLGITITR